MGLTLGLAHLARNHKAMGRGCPAVPSWASRAACLSRVGVACRSKAARKTKKPRDLSVARLYAVAISTAYRNPTSHRSHPQHAHVLDTRGSAFRSPARIFDHPMRSCHGLPSISTR